MIDLYTGIHLAIYAVVFGAIGMLYAHGLVAILYYLRDKRKRI